MPAGTYMYRQRAKNNFFSFGHQIGICAKNYKTLPSRFFMGINGLMCFAIFVIEVDGVALGKHFCYCMTQKLL